MKYPLECIIIVMCGWHVPHEICSPEVMLPVSPLRACVREVRNTSGKFRHKPTRNLREKHPKHRNAPQCNTLQLWDDMTRITEKGVPYRGDLALGFSVPCPQCQAGNEGLGL